ncbi:hypothetical protein POD19_09040 [Micrococcus sp. GPGPB33]|uniref:hypothetical protein n=1 Tax=Micrococcus sp. GPGPB33 TaxID=3023084 RepID=UPI0030C33E0E
MSAARSPRSGRAGRTDPLAWRRAEPAPLMLLKGPEDHAARWVTDRVTQALRERHGQLEIHRLRAGSTSPASWPPRPARPSSPSPPSSRSRASRP